MAIKLMNGEEVKAQANFHWSTYVAPAIWAFLGLMIEIAGVAGSQGNAQPVIIATVAFISFFPAVWVYAQNKTKRYIVTNKRVYVEVGIIAKAKQDIPLNKINDVITKQGILQRIFGAGNLSILTGNSIPMTLPNIDNFEELKNAISETLSSRAA